MKIKLQHSDVSRILLTSWLAGFVYYLIIGSWLLQSDTKSWTQLPGSGIIFMKVVVWLLTASIFGLSYLLLGLLVRISVKRRLPWLKVILVFPFLWVATEFIQSYIVSILLYGPGGHIGSYLNMGFFGYGLITTPLATLSRYVGLYGLSLLVLYISVGIVLAFTRKYKFMLCILAILVLLMPFLRQPSLPTTTIVVGALQLKDIGISEYENVTNQDFSGDNLQLLVLPEYAKIFDPSIPADWKRNVLLQTTKKTDIIFSTERKTATGLTFNTLQHTHNDERVIEQQDKYFLVPTGEYLPWLVQGIAVLSGQKSIIAAFNDNIKLQPATHPEVPFNGENIKIGALVCSGVIATDRYRQLSNQGAVILTNSASLNEFRNATLFHHQLEQFTKFISIANQRPLVQSAKGGGFAFILDANGTQLARAKPNSSEVIYASLAVVAPKTPYTRYGDYIAWLSLFVAASYGLWFFLIKKD